MIDIHPVVISAHLCVMWNIPITSETYCLIGVQMLRPCRYFPRSTVHMCTCQECFCLPRVVLQRLMIYDPTHLVFETIFYLRELNDLWACSHNYCRRRTARGQISQRIHAGDYSPVSHLEFLPDENSRIVGAGISLQRLQGDGHRLGISLAPQDVTAAN